MSAYNDWTDHDDHMDGGHNNWSDHHDWIDAHSDHSDGGVYSNSGYGDWLDHDDALHGDHNDHDDAVHVDWNNHQDTGYSDWTDHLDHNDFGYSDWDDHSDNHMDWGDHFDGGHTDWTDHDDDAHIDWSDHDDTGVSHGDGAYTDWTDHNNWGDHNDALHGDWTDHSDYHADWGNYSDVTHIDWGNYNDYDDIGHTDWTNYSDMHFDWANYVDNTPPHQDWSNHSDTAPYTDWTDHDNWGDHNDALHNDWTDTHSDWSNHDDTAHVNWANHNDALHGDWTDHNDIGNHTDWGDHTDNGGSWTDHDDWNDLYLDWTDHTDTPAQNWTDHTDSGYSDWTDYSDTGTKCKTQLTIIINGWNVSHDTVGADIWRDALNGVGRFEVILNNKSNQWSGDFAPDDDVIIRINGATMMNGYVDDIMPYIDPRGVYTEYIKVSGRDYGMDLNQLYITYRFRNAFADDIVQSALGLAGSEISYLSPSLAPSINYEFDRTYLADGIRDIAKVVNYDFYVQDNAPRLLHFFDIATMGGGIEDTAVILKSIAGDATNNILRLEVGEQYGFSIKNYIEAHAGPVDDHWTELNASDYTTTTSTTITNETTLVLNGLGAIKGARGMNPTTVQLILDFSAGKYTYNSLDMSEPVMASVNYLIHDTTAYATKILRVQLEDISGNVIEWFKIMWGALFFPWWTKCIDCTDQLQNDEWRFLQFPIGEECAIENILMTKPEGTWYYFLNPAPPFDWTQVTKIMFETTGRAMNKNDYVIIDGLKIPNVEAKSISFDPASNANFGLRMQDYYRPDIKSQLELDAYAADELNKSKRPVEQLTITAIGEVNSEYAAQGLWVQAPSSGIPAMTRYRIFKLHHSVKLSPFENEIKGYDYITEYELVKQHIAGVDQEVDPTRFAISKSPTQAKFRELREQQRFRRRTRPL